MAKRKKDKKKKSSIREWGEALLFAAIVVPILNIFVIQSYAIPTSSMEGSMLVGDKLFVSKLHYGPRIPNTPLALPFMHNTIPFIGGRSFSELIKLPYWRLPSFTSIKNNDVVVFNYPDDFRRALPVDKRENYIKRCLGIPGDSLSVVDKQVFVNSAPVDNPIHLQGQYLVTTNGLNFSSAQLKNLGVNIQEYKMRNRQAGNKQRRMFLDPEKAERLKTFSNVVDVQPIIAQAGTPDNCYPKQSKEFNWNKDNYGPIYLPKRGDKIEMNRKNYLLYEKNIRIYENNPSLAWKNGKAQIDGKVVKNYEFKMDYYWMMGDNRDNSLDSRMWGMVPEDHIVGKPIFVWMSNCSDCSFPKIRWGRCMRTVSSLVE